MEVIKGSGCEIELGNKKRKFFVKVYFEPFEIWVDLQGLPNTAFLCAMCDGISLLECEVGDKGKEKRLFINIEWAINEWGGDSEIVDALKKRKQMIIDDLPRLKEKYSEL